MGRHRLWRGLLATVALVTLTGGFGIERDEFQCEQAVARLVDCCPGFDAGSIVCSAGGCGQQRYPDLTVHGAECIIGASCADLQSSGACGAPTRVTCD